MGNLKTLQQENKQLQEHIQKLELKMMHVQKWMEREVKAQIYKVAKSKTSKLTSDVKESFLQESFEEVIANQIQQYFGDLLLLNAPKGTIEGITSAEISFYNMQKNPLIDWFSVVSAYHKVLDLFIESFITNNFRKFAKKKGQTFLRVNDPLEKALNLIVNSKYILSVGRLFWLLRMIKEDRVLYDYGKCFVEYLEKYPDLKEVLLDDHFYDRFHKLNRSEVLSSKRHSGTISKQDTIQARELLIGNFTDTDAMIYQMLKGQSVIY